MFKVSMAEIHTGEGRVMHGTQVEMEQGGVYWTM